MNSSMEPRSPLHKNENDSSSDDEPSLREKVFEYRKAREHGAKRGIRRGECKAKEATHSKSLKNNSEKSTKKLRPRELPSNRPVPVGRNACLGAIVENRQRTVRNFDPRFEDHCGDLRELHVERNYSFIADERERRRKELEDIVERNGSKERSKVVQAERELDRIRQNDLRRNALLRRREILKQVVDEEKEAVRKGKQPFFAKRRELRRLELRSQYDELKRKGGVKKFIVKRRRKLAGKDKKLMANTISKDRS